MITKRLGLLLIIGFIQVSYGIDFDLTRVPSVLYESDTPFGTNVYISHGSSNEILQIKQKFAAYERSLRKGYFSVTAREFCTVKQKLDAFENGKLNLSALNEKNGKQGNRKLIGYYLAQTNDSSAKSKLPISRSFAGFGAYFEAAKLAKEYVSTYSNDWHGWRILGNAYFLLNACDMMNASDEAIAAYSNAVHL